MSTALEDVLRLGIAQAGRGELNDLGSFADATTVADDPPLDELQQRFADALTTERDGLWMACDVIAYAANRAGTKRGRAKVVAAFAAVGHMTSAYARVLCLLSEAFGTESRKPDVSMSLYRSCMRAAKRLARTPADILDEALANGWHAAEVSALGRPESAAATMTGVCLVCGAKTHVTSTVGVGLAMPCVVCIAIMWRDNGDAKAAPRVGVLGAA